MAQRFDTSYLTDSKPDVALESPLQTAGKVAQYRNLLLQGQVHQQQIANEQETLRHTQLANQETERKNTSMANFERAFHEAGGLPEPTKALAIKYNVDSDTLQNFEKGTAELAQKAALASKEKSELAIAHTNLKHQIYAPIAAVTDPVAQANLWEAGQKQLNDAGVQTPEENIPYAGASQVQGELAKNTYYDHVLKQAEELRKQQGEQRLEDKAPVELAKLGSEATHAQQVATGTQIQSPQERAQLTREQARDAQIATNEAAQRKIAQQNANTAAGHLAETRRVNAMEYGPGMIDSWVENLKANPDSVKELPPKLRSVVGQKFTETTGLPLPTPLGTAGQTQETAARNAIDNATWLAQAAKNPLIANQTGPLLGRLGNAEQKLGTAVGLTPEAEQLGQEFRTRARYFVMTEGKALLGGRLPQQLMEQLEKSSANPVMDKNLFQGALNGAISNAGTILENADKQRFGGKARTPAMRGIQAPAAAPAKINVISPEGVPGTIDSDKWDAAQKRGFKRQ